MILVTKENAKIGLKVKRSLAFNYGDQDKNSNFGTIVGNPNYYPIKETHNWVKVEWENGDVFSYKLSQDLLIYQEKRNIELITL